jgi:ribosomal-protein-serine acetyltransferase
MTTVRIRLSTDAHLRPLGMGDAEELYALVARNRAYLSEWMPWAESQTLEGTAAFLRTVEQRQAENNGVETAIVVDGRIAGTAGFHAVDWVARATSIGYWLSEDRQGRGLMTMAVRALVDLAFAEWRLHRVEIRAAVANTRSRAIPERLGFREEGVLREAERVGDRYYDLVVYGLLATDSAS